MKISNFFNYKVNDPQKTSSFVSFLIMLSLCSCGGGTSGTGVKEFQGVVVSSAGEPIEGVEISIVNTERRTVTNERGNFEVEAETRGRETVSIEIQTAMVTDVIEVQELPAGDAVVNVEFTVNEIEGSVAIASIAIEPVETEPMDPSLEENSDQSFISEEMDNFSDSPEPVEAQIETSATIEESLTEGFAASAERTDANRSSRVGEPESGKLGSNK